MSEQDFKQIMRVCEEQMPYKCKPSKLTKAQAIEQLVWLKDNIKEHFGVYYHRQACGCEPMQAIY